MGTVETEWPGVVPVRRVVQTDANVPRSGLKDRLGNQAERRSTEGLIHEVC